MSRANINKIKELLARQQAREQLKQKYGINYVKLLVSDVDGDWLETWGEELQECNLDLRKAKNN